MEVLIRLCLLLALFRLGRSDTDGPREDPTSLIRPMEARSGLPPNVIKDIVARTNKADIKDILARMDRTDIKDIIGGMKLTDIKDIIADMDKKNIQSIIAGMNRTDIKDKITLIDITDIQAIIAGMKLTDIKAIIPGLDSTAIQAIITTLDISDIQTITAILDIPEIQAIIASKNLTDIQDNLREVNWSDVLTNIIDVIKDNADVSQHCRLDITRYGLDLLQGKNYALQMLDACGKPPSGLMTGNLNWLGRYSQCRQLTGADHNISFGGKYFVATFQLPPPQDLMKLRIGLCLPSSCRDDDVTRALTNSAPVQALIGQLNLQMTVEARENKPIGGGTVAAICICGVLGLFLLLGTMYDVMIYQPGIEAASCETGAALSKSMTKQEGVVGRVLLPFSVYTNIINLLSTEQPPNSIRCLHGIRFLSMSWVILGHTYAFGINAADNMLTLIGLASQFTSQVILNGILSVDSFFFLSGLLLSYHLLKQIEKFHMNGKTVPFAMIYVQRYLRLTPTYMFAVMLVVWVYPQLFSGPIPVDGFNDPAVCQQHWWTNLLYINNLVTPRIPDQCFGVSWYLANDMQFFVIGVPVVYLMYRWWYVGVAALLNLLLASFVTTAVIATNEDLTNRMIDGDRGFGNIYSQPYYRIGPYLVGMTVGWLLLKTEGKIRARNKTIQVLSFIGWCVATASALAVVYGLYGTYHGVVMTIHERALYYTVHRTVWALSLAWVVFACYHGYGSVVNSILSWSAWVPLSRLTYCAYLIHPIVMMVYFFSRDNPVHFSNLDVIYIFLGHLVLSFGLAFLLAVAVEVPLMRLQKTALDKRTKQTSNPSVQQTSNPSVQQTSNPSVQQDSEQASKIVAIPGSDVRTK